ncbi:MULTISPECIES: hypothetical protein [Bradyrhizobium]|uniref:hypothetical protein n=1 Tax=Bradyrhizobium TaxID=374 RepID=UPI0004AE6E74|nr:MULTISPECIES: hypothetical protein [Bradyrhizobium]MDI2103932.1 hypothetical protein [Bradyrhizobium sp. Mp64]
MSISFETEDACTVFLPDTQAILVEAQKAREALERDRAYQRSHLYPLFDATARFACSLLIAPQGCNEFELPQDPWIVSIGDDFHFAWGPKAFPATSLDAAIRAAGHCVLITSGPDPFPYRVAATVAARDRKNALLIETLPHQKVAWQRRIEFVRGADELPITYCIPEPETKGAA